MTVALCRLSIIFALVWTKNHHPCLATTSPESSYAYAATTTAELNIDDSERDAIDEEKPEKTCNLYMAPSSLVGHAGMGVYSVHEYQIGDLMLTGGPDGPSIAVVDAEHSGEGDDEPAWMDFVRTHWINSFGQYWWGRGVPDHVLFEGRRDVFDFQITFGSLPNHHCLLDSVDHIYAEDGVYEDSLLNRYTDPGAGAYSYHRGRNFRATKDIHAGQEIFLDYGYCSRAPNKSLHFPKWTSFIPMLEEYKSASRAVKAKYTQLIKEYGSAERIPTDIAVVPPPELHPMAAMLLPNTSGEILEIAKLAPQEIGFLNSRTELISEILARTMASKPRTKEWVLENGVCIEHLVPAPSRIRQAGQGGIVQHVIKAGDIIVPAPLLHILDRNVLNVEYRTEHEPVRSQQLLLNYCFGHPESTLLLCPDTNAILINHCSTRTRDCGDEQGPNAEIRWSTGWDTSDTEAFLNMTIEQLGEHTDRGLSMEVVALRDLVPGDEVFIDYGIEWEVAWANHVKGWKPPQDEHIDPLLEDHPELRYFSTKVANLDEHAPILPFFVSGDLRDETDHPYIFTACIYYPTEMDEHEVWLDTETDLEALSDDELLEYFADDGSMYEGTYSRHAEGTYWPCRVLLEEEKQEGDEDSVNYELRYTVRIEQRDYDKIAQQPWDKNELPRYLTNYPRSSIRYFAKPYESDQHLFYTFRHYIGIPDEMFPTQWKNTKQATSDEAA